MENGEKGQQYHLGKKWLLKKKRPTDFLAFFCTGSVMSEHMEPLKKSQ